jgi:hypothetical protein
MMGFRNVRIAILPSLLFAGLGIASVVLALGGLFTGIAAGAPFVTLGSNSAKVASELAKPAGTGVWIGAYIQVLSLGAFLAFAAWVTAQLGGGLLGTIARSAATGYATVTLVALCAWGAVDFRAGHGMGTQLATALVDVPEALLIGTWFLFAFFLLAIAYGLALAGQTICSGFRYGFRNSLLALPLIPLTHGLYGLGFWYGLFTRFQPPDGKQAQEISLEKIEP